MIIDDLAKVNSPSRRTILAVLVVIAGIAVYNWMVAPHTARLLATMNYGDSLADVAKEKDHLTAAIATQRKKLDGIRGQFAHLQSSLFTTESAKKFFSDLQAITIEEGCALHSLEFQAGDQKSKGTSEVAGKLAKTAALGLTGEYGHIVTLLERLQKRTQKVWMELEMEAVDDQTTQVKCVITITIYLLPSDERILHE